MSSKFLFEPWKAAPQVAADSPVDTLHELLTPTAKDLQQANERISARIKASPAAAVVHEEAAFLLGVFGMRENARQFGDLRPLLCRMTAHLALAEHLRGGGKPSLIGDWAQVFHDYHAGRPLRARERMQTIATEGDSGRWKRVVELLITKDWRRTGDLSEPSLAEALAHARALQVHCGNSKLMEFVGGREDLQGLPDWSRMLSDLGNFALRQWSSHEAAVEWEESVMAYCRKLPDSELLESLVSTSEPDFHKDLKVTAAYVRKHPERIPMGLWYDYQFSTLDVGVQTRMPDQAAWFREVSPPGTAHDPTRRIRFKGIAGKWISNIRKLHEIDPWNPELCYENAENAGHSLEGVKAAWGEVREYSKRPLRQTLKGPGLTVAERIETLKILIKMDPTAGLELGAVLVMEKRPEEAIQAYEEAYQKAEDRVAVSNRSRWMIHHYKSKGDDVKAREIADHHAEVYSASGLEVALALAIHEKDLKRARELADALAECYGDNSGWVKVAWFISGDEKALRRVFPGRLREVTLADFPAEENPAGCRVMSSSSTLLAVGRRPGDVVVAIDGKRVENYPQYTLLMGWRLDPGVRLIYRRGNAYQKISCLLPDRVLQVEMNRVGE